MMPPINSWLVHIEERDRGPHVNDDDWRSVFMESGDSPGQDVSAQLLGIVGFDVNAAFDARAKQKGIDPGKNFLTAF